MGALVSVIIVLVIVGLVVYSLFLKRHGEKVGPQAGWVPTDEVFRDPSTDRLMRVWVDPASGARNYVAERNLPNQR